jgi:hypothetical protein
MMSLSKLWLFLLTALAGLLVLLLLLSPVQVRKALDQNTQRRMELAQQSTTLLLQNSARLWIDTAAQLAGDAVLVSALEELQRGQNELQLVHKNTSEHLRRANQTLRLSFLLLVDARGRVLARIGEDEEVYQDNVIGYPIVADAVRGYRLDDLWFEKGRLYRLAAAPVIAAARDRYVGAVVLGQAVGDDLAGQIRAAVGMDVAFLCAGKVMGSSLKALPKGLLQRAETGAWNGQPVPVGEEDRPELALLSPLPGEAAAQGAVIALVTPAAAGVSLPAMARALVEAAATAELRITHLAAVGAAVVVALLLGLVFLRVEAEGPLARLLAEVRELDRGRDEHLEEGGYRGRWRELALAVNDALRGARPVTEDYIAAPEAAAESGREPAPPPIPARPAPPPPITSTLPTQISPRPTRDEPAPGSPWAASQQMPVPAEPEFPTMPDGMATMGSHESPHSSARTQPMAPPELTLPRRGLPTERTVAPTIPMQPPRFPQGETEASSARTLLDPVTEELLEGTSQVSPVPGAPTVQDIPPSVVHAAIEQALGTPPAPFTGFSRTMTGPISSAPAPSAPSARAQRQPTGVISVAEVRRRAAEPTGDIWGEPTARRPPPQEPDEDDLEASFRQTYQEFMVTKQRCHESVEGLTYEKFAIKLRQSREQIMRQHSCRSVRFHVYVKDGKAALKATPVAR